jgi:hypothetical protein
VSEINLIQPAITIAGSLISFVVTAAYMIGTLRSEFRVVTARIEANERSAVERFEFISEELDRHDKFADILNSHGVSIGKLAEVAARNAQEINRIRDSIK